MKRKLSNMVKKKRTVAIWKNIWIIKNLKQAFISKTIIWLLCVCGQIHSQKIKYSRHIRKIIHVKKSFFIFRNGKLVFYQNFQPIFPPSIPSKQEFFQSTNFQFGVIKKFNLDTKHTIVVKYFPFPSVSPLLSTRRTLRAHLVEWNWVSGSGSGPIIFVFDVHEVVFTSTSTFHKKWWKWTRSQDKLIEARWALWKWKFRTIAPSYFHSKCLYGEWT